MGKLDDLVTRTNPGGDLGQLCFHTDGFIYESDPAEILALAAKLKAWGEEMQQVREHHRRVWSR